ncbi:hypothetical protein AB0J72_22965 [Dactylosporangium sp. NPDC049742]
MTRQGHRLGSLTVSAVLAAATVDVLRDLPWAPVTWSDISEPTA